MNKICTTIEQSKRLIELGIDANTADMWWAERYGGHTTMDYQYIVDDTPYYYLSLTKPSDDNYSLDSIKDIPCWSLSALSKLMPKVESMGYNAYPILEHDDEGFAISSPIYNTRYYEEPIDAAFEMVCWLKENGKL